MTMPRPIARVTHAALHLSEDGLAALEAPFRGPRAPSAPSAAIAEVAAQAAPPRQDRIGALRIRDFRFLFIGTVTSGYGQWATMIGLGWLAYVLSGNSAAQLAWVVAVGGAMRLLSAPWIGVVLDRYHRRSVTVWSTLASAALGLGLAVLVITDMVAFWQLYVFSALEGIISSANQNVRQTFVYDVTTPDTLSNAIALNAIAQNLSRISGPPLAGAMIGLLGTASPFLFIAVMMTIATFFTLLISKSTRQAAFDTDNPFRSLWVGIRYVASDRPMLGLLLSGAVPGIFLYPYIPLLPVFAGGSAGHRLDGLRAPRCLGRLGVADGTAGAVVAWRCASQGHHCDLGPGVLRGRTHRVHAVDGVHPVIGDARGSRHLPRRRVHGGADPGAGAGARRDARPRDVAVPDGLLADARRSDPDGDGDRGVGRGDSGGRVHHGGAGVVHLHGHLLALTPPRLALSPAVYATNDVAEVHP